MTWTHILEEHEQRTTVTVRVQGPLLLGDTHALLEDVLRRGIDPQSLVSVSPISLNGTTTLTMLSVRLQPAPEMLGVPVVARGDG